MQTGYCPPPAPCSRVTDGRCSDPRNPVCIDDPRDDCEPEKGGSECIGICVATRSSSLATTSSTLTTVTKRATATSDPAGEKCGGVEAKRCARGYECSAGDQHFCDYKNGGFDCAGVCVKQRMCDSRGLPPCFEGEVCSHDRQILCTGAEDCPGVCRRAQPT